jgi:serine/threonine-protein kinase
MDKYSGKRLDARYEIQELIGVGGMAYVYKAYDIIDDRTVAIKILKEEFLGNQDFMRRFKNESKAIAMLDHPNIVKVYSVSFGDRMQYIVMEYIDGISLKQYIDRQPEVSWKEAVHFTSQILKALHHAHENGIIHRDIKPQNIMLLQDGSIKMTDFGIARFSGSQTRTMTDKAIGSVHYIAPEQARGELTDGKTDIYSVGVLLYEMITGQLPFEADNAVSVAIMQLQTDPKPPREINPSIPVGLEEITLKAMQKNPDQRYRSAREMLVDLDAFRRDPNIRFHYVYSSVGEEPTRVVDSLDEVTSREQSMADTQKIPVAPVVPERSDDDVRYDDRYDYDDLEYEEESPKKKTGLIIGICVGIAALLAVIGVGMCFAFGVFSGDGSSVSEVSDVDLPNFVGQRWEDVKSNSDYKDFDFQVTYENSDTVEEGLIISQNPKGTKQVKSNATIELVVSSGAELFSIPNVRDDTKSEAEAKLKDAGLTNYEFIETTSETVEEGRVIKISPTAGTAVPASETILVYISTGTAKVTVPPILNVSQETAQSMLEAEGLTLGDVSYDYSDTIEENLVISTSPSVGSQVEKGSAVSVVISRGPEITTKNVSVTVNLPSNVAYAMELEAYVDGVLYENDTVTSSQGSLSLNLEGETTATVKVYLDDQLYAEYVVDYQSGTVQQTGSYQYYQGGNSSSEDETYSGYVDPSITEDDFTGITN